MPADAFDPNGTPLSALHKAFRVEDHLDEALSALLAIDPRWVADPPVGYSDPTQENVALRTAIWHIEAARQLRSAPIAPATTGLNLTDDQLRTLIEGVRNARP